MPARILIIEDDAAHLALVEYLLKAAGHHIFSASDGAQGARSAREHRPDLVICDLQMPVLNGSEVLQQLRKDPLTCEIPVVAVAAFSKTGDHSDAINAGFDGYLSKPIVPELFVGQVEEYLPAFLLRSATRGIA